jgi:hypothetical protein
MCLELWPLPRKPGLPPLFEVPRCMANVQGTHEPVRLDTELHRLKRTLRVGHELKLQWTPNEEEMYDRKEKLVERLQELAG